MMKKAISLVFSLLISSFLAVPLFAAEVKLIPSGNRVFTLQGYDIPNVGGIEAVIEYENMQKPQVQRGSIINNAPNPMFVANVNLPNKIILAALQANNQFTGTGPIAIISFQPIAGKTGTARLTKIKLATEKASIDPATSNSPVSDSYNTGGENTNNSGGDGGGDNSKGDGGGDNSKGDGGGDNSKGDGGGDNNSGNSGNSGGNTTTTGGGWMGTITMPTDDTSRSRAETEQQRETQQEQAQYQQPEEAQQSASQDGQPAAEEPLESEKAPGEQKFSAHKSLLDQFREFKDEKTPKALTALFEGFSIPGVRQEPPVVLSDGKAVVKIYLDLPSAGKQSPNFALKGAKLVSLKNDEQGKWVIEALPAKNASDVRVTALQDEAMTEIPLTVAQPVAPNAVSREGKWDDAAFALFLKEKGTEKAPQFDLNGDGLRNHVDEYIYTANYLIRNDKGKKEKGAEKKPAHETGKEAAKPAPPATPGAKPGKSK